MFGTPHTISLTDDYLLSIRKIFNKFQIKETTFLQGNAFEFQVYLHNSYCIVILSSARDQVLLKQWI